jgi:hypothetical protein
METVIGAYRRQGTASLRPLRLVRARSAARLWLLLCCLGAGTARAGLLDPGPLTKQHAHLEGLKNCTQCHGAATGEKVNPQACLNCHKELAPRIAKGEGFHGKLTAEEKNKCEKCHNEHQGRDFAIVDWGDKGKKGFDHTKAGWPLNGKHAKADCLKCHETRLVSTEVVKTWISAPEHKARETFLGLGNTCVNCHFDEHRNQLQPPDCKQCHDESEWKKAKGFNHDKTAFALTGAHQKVDCQKCHARELDEIDRTKAFPKPVNEVFSRFKPVAHNNCTDCHKDVHEGRFGAKCTDCHVTASWKEIHQGGVLAGGTRADRKFHESTRYPLRGAHENVSCDACHGKGKKAVFKNMQFAVCTDCHVDAHQGQLGRPGSPQIDCTRCHSVETFGAPKFEVEQHAKTSYPLEGAHAAVFCQACHLKDEARVRKLGLSVDRAGASLTAVKLSPAVFLLKVETARCDSCHKDVHGGQFARLVAGPPVAAAAATLPACESCHSADSFHTLTKFDHQKTRFPLEGKHAQATCNQCHLAPAPGAPVQYRGVSRACSACHQDAHVGQFSDASGPPDCAKCHVVDDFKKVRFNHAPPDARFALDGKHKDLECKKCHEAVEVAPKVTSVRYKPLPINCEGCHVDEHDGAFRRFAK